MVTSIEVKGLNFPSLKGLLSTWGLKGLGRVYTACIA